MTEEELRAIEAELAPYYELSSYQAEELLAHIPTLVAEVRRLREALRTVQGNHQQALHAFHGWQDEAERLREALEECERGKAVPLPPG